jgi:colanic acid biosynthesis glycosyl transferase WcaI
VRVLLVSQYFPPEPGATQNRVGTFAGALAARGHEVSVVCEQPCHPAGVFQEGFGKRPLETERLPNQVVRRLWVATSPVKTTARRLAFYGTFAAGAGAAVLAMPRHDVMFASSPPLPGVLAAAWAARARRLPLVVDVRDLWPAAAEALGELSNPRVLRVLERAERGLYRQAAAVTATTRPFCTHIDAVAGRPVSVHLPNGALDELVALPDTSPPADGPFVVGYAGNFGIAQGLRIALDAADRLRDEPVRFVLLGGGPLDRELRDEAAARGLGNVEFRTGIPVAEVGAFLQSCDALLVPLRDHPLLEDFIPSKLYDAFAVGRPAIVAARGEAAALARETGGGEVVPPEDGEALAAAVRRLMSDPELVRSRSRAGREAAAGLARSRQVDRLEQVLSRAAGG